MSFDIVDPAQNNEGERHVKIEVMLARRFDATKDYDEVCEWWTTQGFQALPKNFLSKVGFIVEGDDGTKLCAGWFYETDSAWSLVEWVVGNPKADKDSRRRGLDLLIETIIEYAKTREFAVIFTSVQHPALIKRYEQYGLQKADIGMTNLIGRLK